MSSTSTASSPSTIGYRRSTGHGPPGSSTEPRHRAAQTLRVALLRLLWLQLCWLALDPAYADGELRFARAEFVVSDSWVPPLSGWQPQALPDSWIHDHPGVKGIAWYRIRFALDAVPHQGKALLVGRVATTGQVWCNGAILNPEVRFTEDGGRSGTYTGNRPMLITLPAGLLRTGENVLHLRVQGFGLGGDGVWDVRIGDLEKLRAPWLVRQVPQQWIPQALFVLMGVSSLFGMLVWWRDGRLRSLQFMAVMILWTVVLASYVLPELPFTRVGLHIYVVVLLSAFYWVLLDLFYRYSGSGWLWYPKVVALVSVLTLLGLLGFIAYFDDAPEVSRLLSLFMVPTALLRLLATVMLLQSAWRTRTPENYMLAAAEVLWFSGHVQVIGIIGGWLPPLPFRIDPACSLPLYLVLQYLFVERLIREREDAVRAQQAAIRTERARILQDMHDGMGAQLITALRLAEQPHGDRTQVAHGIQEALQDLRLIIDSMEAHDEGLVPLLGNLRYRLQPRLSALGIHLRWDVQPLPELERMDTRVVLGILRIVQEAMNNAIKHARCTRIDVSINRQRGAPVVGVADNGVGLGPAATQGSGRGLGTMARRAQQLGAELRIGPRDGGGTVVALHLPVLPRAAQPSRTD